MNIKEINEEITCLIEAIESRLDAGLSVKSLEARLERLEDARDYEREVKP